MSCMMQRKSVQRRAATLAFLHDAVQERTVLGRAHLDQCMSRSLGVFRAWLARVERELSWHGCIQHNGQAFNRIFEHRGVKTSRRRVTDDVFNSWYTVIQKFIVQVRHRKQMV